MKVLNLSYDDYANFAYENAKALISVGIEAISLKRVNHPFGYEQTSVLATADRIRREIKNADIVQLFHSDSTWLFYAHQLGKRVYVYHTGTTYRQNPEHCNNIFNPYVEAAFTDQCEFIGLGMKKEQYVATAIDTNKFMAAERLVKAPYTVSHYPSNPTVKGTDKIIDMMMMVETPNIFKYSKDLVDNQKQMHRMDDCDIYVELFSLMQHNKSYGCFGVTAFEAASLGKIVFTNNIRNDVYEAVYGKSPFIIVNTEEEFKQQMNEVLNLTPEQINSLSVRARYIMEKKHSYSATGARLKELLNL